MTLHFVLSFSGQSPNPSDNTIQAQSQHTKGLISPGREPGTE
jgi:hypothetical protein